MQKRWCHNHKACSDENHYSFGEKCEKQISSSSISEAIADVLIDNSILETIQKLYESIQKRLETVIKENGGKTF